MRVRDCEKVLIGSIKELLQDRDYFYNSSVGAEYCNFTKDGEQAVLEVVRILGARLIKAQEQADIERSKALVLDELKK